MAEARIDGLGAKGDGLAKVDGALVYVDGAAPGDIVDLEIVGDRGRIAALRAAGPNRTEPFCPHAAACGGCQVQHLNDQAVAAWKTEIVRNALMRRSLDPSVVEPVVTVPKACRRRIGLKARRRDRDVVLGYRPKRSGGLVNVTSCGILHPRLHDLLPELRAMLGRLSFDGEAAVQATVTDTGWDIDLDARRVDPTAAASAAGELSADARFARLTIRGDLAIQRAPPMITFGDVALALPPRAFLQAAAEGEALMADAVGTWTHGARRTADLFAGCGAFALRMAKRGPVDAFEQNSEAVTALRSAADQTFGGGRLRSHVRDLERAPVVRRELDAYDAVVVDPPRAGAARQAAEIAASHVPTVVMASCAPNTFARDARTLVDGGYRLETVRPVDQFRYSHHIEVAAVFRR